MTVPPDRSCNMNVKPPAVPNTRDGRRTERETDSFWNFRPESSGSVYASVRSLKALEFYALPKDQLQEVEAAVSGSDVFESKLKPAMARSLHAVGVREYVIHFRMTASVR